MIYFQPRSYKFCIFKHFRGDLNQFIVFHFLTFFNLILKIMAQNIKNTKNIIDLMYNRILKIGEND